MVTAAPLSPHSIYPVHVEAEHDAAPSRWLWLVKWVLALPHYLVLALLWTAFVVLSVVALGAIVLTGRYPRSIFEFNVGVLRWTWRVAYYSYGALATDRYPPFTLAEVEDYPAHLRVDHPAHLSRGLALIKWWLLAIPHYLIVALLVGGGATVAWRATNTGWRWDGGLIEVLVLIVGVILLVTGTYPRPLYDLLLGLNRWVIRVAAYAGLMTDAYPPFRLDMGEHDVVSLYTGPPPASAAAPPVPGPTPPAAARSGADRPGNTAWDPGSRADPGHLPAAPPSGPTWTTGRLTAAVLGALVLLLGLGGVGAGAAAGSAHLFARDDGYLTSRELSVQSPGHAVVLGEVALNTVGVPVDLPEMILGEVRVRATAAGQEEVFLGITTPDQARAYLRGTGHQTLAGPGVRREHDGGAPAAPPTGTDLWYAQASGPGTQVVETQLVDGRWVPVVMRPDGSAGIDAEVDVGAVVPWLGGFALTSLLTGLVALVGGAVLIVAASRRATRG